MSIIESDGPGPRLEIPDDFLQFELVAKYKRPGMFARADSVDLLMNGSSVGRVSSNPCEFRNELGEVLFQGRVIFGENEYRVLESPIVNSWAAFDEKSGREMARELTRMNGNPFWFRTRGREPFKVHIRSNFFALCSEDDELLMAVDIRSQDSQSAYIRHGLDDSERNVLLFYASHVRLRTI